MVEKVFFVGDVHGCFKELELLLKKAKWDPHCHRLILLGDLIHKGPDSLQVLSWVRAQKRVTALLGNHELKFIQAVEEGQELSESFKKLKQDMGEDLTDWLNYIKSWPVFVEEEDFLAVHGGLVPGEKPNQSKTEHLVNIRYWDEEKGELSEDSTKTAWHDLYKGDKLVVYAHWAKQGLKIKPHSIGLDTGCVYGGKLTGLWLPERNIVQVSCPDCLS